MSSVASILSYYLYYGPQVLEVLHPSTTTAIEMVLDLV